MPSLQSLQTRITLQCHRPLPSAVIVNVRRHWPLQSQSIPIVVNCHSHRPSQSSFVVVTIRRSSKLMFILIIASRRSRRLSPFIIVDVHCSFINIVVRHCSSQFRLTSVSFYSTFVHVQPLLFVRPLSSIYVHRSPFILVNASYSSNRMYCVYTYLILYSSNCMYVFFKIGYRIFKKLI